MTEETRTEAEKLSNVEGTGKSAIAELDKWSLREKARDDLYRRDVESNIAHRQSVGESNAAGLAINRRAAERDEATHALYLRDATRGMELREITNARNEEHLALAKQSVAAFERIAEALEKLTVGK